MLRGNKIVCTKSELNAQHGHAHKCSKIFFRNGGQIFTKLGMYHQGS